MSRITGRGPLAALLFAAAVVVTLSSRAAGATDLPSVTLDATVPEVALDGSSNGVLTFSRTGGTADALTVKTALGPLEWSVPGLRTAWDTSIERAMKRPGLG